MKTNNIEIQKKEDGHETFSIPMKNENRKIVLKLDEYLKKNKIPKLRFSKKSKIDYRTILRYCNHDINSIKFTTLETICNALNCELSDIIELK